MRRRMTGQGLEFNLRISRVGEKRDQYTFLSLFVPNIISYKVRRRSNHVDTAIDIS